MICEGAQVSICWITPQAEWTAFPVPRSSLLGIIIHCHSHRPTPLFSSYAPSRCVFFGLVQVLFISAARIFCPRA